VKFEVRNKNEAEMFQSFLVFFLVTAGTICVRLSTIFSNHIWLDDIQQKHNLAVGSMMSPRVFLYSKVHLWALENLHPSIIRMGYVFLYGATAVLVAKLLRKILVRKWDAEIISVVAFLAPTTSIVFVFINGSYNVLFLLTYVLLISVLVKLFSTRKENQRLYLHQLAIAGLVFLAIGPLLMEYFYWVFFFSCRGGVLPYAKILKYFGNISFVPGLLFVPELSMGFMTSSINILI